MQMVVSALPIVVLMMALTVFRMKAWKASLLALFVSLLLSLVFCRAELPPSAIPLVVAGGVGFAIYPICLVILAALFVYSIVVQSGAMNTIRTGMTGITEDRRILALLIVWGFGNFMEGMAGFGTAVAIPAALLIGLGFDPMRSVLMCLIANTTPTVFGSVGVPVVMLANVSGCNVLELAWYASFLQIGVTILTPILILLAYGGKKSLKGAWMPILISESAFIVPWLLSARYLGFELPDIAGGLCVMIALSAYATKGRIVVNVREQLFAWAPFIFVVIILTAATFLPANLKVYLSPGTLVLIAAFAGGYVQGLDMHKMLYVLKNTMCSYWSAFVTIAAVLALARVMSEAGMVSSLAHALVSATGSAYPFFAPLVGALGGFITGSGTSSNVLFGGLQVDVATSIGASRNLLAAANIMGAGIGKMICPQSIAIGTAAAGIAFSAGEVLKRALCYFVPVIALACIASGVFALWM